MAKQSAFGKPSAKEDVFEFKVPESSGLRIPEAAYPGKCVGLNRTQAKSSGNDMFVWNFTITKGEYAGKDFPLYTALTPNAMWKVAETLAAFGITGEVGEKLKFSKKDVIGMLVMLNVQDDEYNGRPTSKLQGVSAMPGGAGKKGAAIGSEVTGEEEEEEEEEGGRLEDGEEEEAEEEEAEEEEEEEVDLEQMDRAALKTLIKEQGFNITVTKSMSDDDIRRAIEAKNSETEEEEEEEEPVPPKKSNKAASTLGKKK